MTASTVVVTAPSRLHFGMFSFGQENVREFGGVGTMIDAPGLRVRLRKARHFHCHGPLSARAEHAARRFAETFLSRAEPDCEIEVEQVSEEHAGLGTGTQLALAIGRGLASLHGLPDMELSCLASCLNRAQRSAVGTYGFELGGLIVEGGKRRGETLAPLIGRWEIPSGWRFLLIRPRPGKGLAGQAEIQAFSSMPPVPYEVSAELAQILLMRMLPAIVKPCFEEFSAGLHDFGALAGQAFASCQHGSYASPEVANIIRRLREEGVQGVGQSSWGPTVFALLPSPANAERIAEQLPNWGSIFDSCTTCLAAPCNAGVRVTSVADADAS